MLCLNLNSETAGKAAVLGTGSSMEHLFMMFYQKDESFEDSAMTIDAPVWIPAGSDYRLIVRD